MIKKIWSAHIWLVRGHAFYQNGPPHGALDTWDDNFFHFWQNLQAKQWPWTVVTIKGGSSPQKGTKYNIDSYHSPANHCSSLNFLKVQQGIYLTGKQQHGLKNVKVKLPYPFNCNPWNEDNYVLIASADLGAALIVVNIELLMVWLRLIGLPTVEVDLIEVWLIQIILIQYYTK